MSSNSSNNYNNKKWSNISRKTIATADIIMMTNDWHSYWIEFRVDNEHITRATLNFLFVPLIRLLLLFLFVLYVLMDGVMCIISCRPVDIFYHLNNSQAKWISSCLPLSLHRTSFLCEYGCRQNLAIYIESYMITKSYPTPSTHIISPLFTVWIFSLIMPLTCTDHMNHSLYCQYECSQ